MTGKPIGILMLQTQFPRFVGDIGNPRSFDFPVLYQVVPMADPGVVVRGDPAHLLPAFIAAGRDLVALGACAVSTSCGFLTLFQDALSAALDVPVVTSSLLQVAPLQAALPADKRVGILTIAGSALTPAHLAAAKVPEGCPIGTTEGGREFTKAILSNCDVLDYDLALADNLRAARDLVDRHKDIAALVLECTNMGPYAQAIEGATGVPVHSIVSHLRALHPAL